MDDSSARNLCRHLISSAIRRCRISGELCRLTVGLKSSPLANPPVVRISIADTGHGSCLEEFQDVKNLSESSFNEIQDGAISISTTSICDNEIFHYNIDLKQKDCIKRLAKLPPSSKNGATFSGTEVSFSTFHSVDNLLADITCFFRQTLIMKVPKVGIELVVEKGDFPEHQSVNVIVANECIDLPSESNAVCLESGLVDYVLKHGNQKDSTCHSCFPIREHLKTGTGVVCSKSNRNIETTMEAVVVISELSELMNPSCFRVCGSKTEVLYFNDFSPGSISQSLLNGLKIIDWRSYGLSLKCISDEDGCAFVEWEDLPPGFHIDIAIHCHHNKLILPPAKERNVDRNLAKKAVKLALNDLKEKNAGVLLSAHAIKIRSYAPDLAKTIAGLISTSNDVKFRGECASLLGLHSHDAESIMDCIKQRLISVIDLNDREPQTKRMREGAPLLFHDDCFQETEFADEEYEDGEVSFSALDL
ncbi:type 2 DNA topoisomerase 6 subunit B-like [Cynara cardunculus var. scolymus]|uniref:type 2 DNA topoisomerase 6 subunit B-like n=1 Tax=Cynara cardunculus var. scolymus TaxID=59895 RepID=UPI000D62DCF4|nr:type 2 DNA topoisomerase 6 subunit B-like [Cynara cardunculus var. scolymus]